AIGTPIVTGDHPLEDYIEALGMPVDIVLAIIGFIIVGAPLGIVTGLSRLPSNQELLPILLLGTSANIFLRFWPPATIIFVGLLCGWMLADFIPRGRDVA
ncbi:MAG: hypothetical protein GTO14_07670, partial [Anaerolineales bacterium]|nr:hypothetical protein [Anaerolineales bacterium]